MQEIFLRILDRFRFTLVLATVLVVPFFLGGERPLAVFVMRGLIAAAGVLALAPLLFGRGKFETEPRATLLPLGIFLVFIAYVFFQSVGGHAVFARGNGFGTAVVHETREQAVQLVFYALFFFLCIDSFHSKKRVRFLTFLVAAQVLLLVAVGYTQRMQSLPLVLGHFDPAGMPFFSTFLNENHYGAYLLTAGFLFLGASAYGYESAGAKHRSDAFLLENIFLLVVITLGAASSFYAEARAAFLGQAIVIPLFFLAAIGGRNRGRAFFVLLVLGTLVFVFIQMFFPQIRQSYEAVPAAFSDRWNLVKDGWEIFRDYPFFGAGLGAYHWIARAYQSLGGGFFHRDHLACEYLELLMDTGIIGSALFAAPFLILIPSAFLRSRRSPSRWCRTMGLASFFAVVCVLVTSFLEYYLRTPAIALFFVLYLSLLVKMGSLYENEKERAESPPEIARNVFKGPKRFVPWVALAVILFLSRYAYAHFVTDEVFEDFHRYYQAFAINKAALRTIIPSHAAILEGLLQSDSSNSRGWASLGNVYYDLAQKKEGSEFTDAIEKSMDAHLKATQLAPTWPDHWLSLGQAKLFAGHSAEGLADMEHAVELSPASVDLYLYLILAYWHAAEYATWEEEKERMKDRAFQWLEAATKVPGGIRSDSVWFLQPALNTEANRNLLSGLVKEWEDRQAVSFIDNARQRKERAN